MANRKRLIANQQVNKLFFALSKAINNKGIDYTIENLNTLSYSDKIKDEYLGNLIVEIISKKTEDADFAFQKGRFDGKAQDTACLIAFFLKKYANFNQNEISEKICRNKSQVSKYITRISQLKRDGIPSNEYLLSLVEEIEMNIHTIIKKK
jgi:hypothetical protein